MQQTKMADDRHKFKKNHYISATVCLVSMKFGTVTHIVITLTLRRCDGGSHFYVFLRFLSVAVNIIDKLILFCIYYRQGDNTFGSVRVCVCVCVRLSVGTLLFEPLDF